MLITASFTGRNYKRLEGFSIRKSKMDTLSYRLVKVGLSTGEVEILMANLDNSFTVSDLAEIYRLRWGIETAFNGIKNHQMLGTFSGYSEIAVRQDIWCNLLFYNLQTITMLEATEMAKDLSEKRENKPSKNKKKENKGYKVNRNIGAGILRSHLFDLFTCKEKEPDDLLEKMQLYYLQSLETVKDANKERKRKMHRQNDRHHTELNYERGF